MHRPNCLPILLLASLVLAACGPSVYMARTGPELRPWLKSVVILSEPPATNAVEVGVVSADAVSASAGQLLEAMQAEAAHAGANALLLTDRRAERELHEGADFKNGRARYRKVDAMRHEATATAFRLLRPNETPESLTWVPPTSRVAWFRIGTGLAMTNVSADRDMPAGREGSMLELSTAATWWPTAHVGAGANLSVQPIGSGDTIRALDLGPHFSVRAASPTGRVLVGLEPAASLSVPLSSDALYDATVRRAYSGDQYQLAPQLGYTAGASIWAMLRIKDAIALRVDFFARLRHTRVRYLYFTESDPAVRDSFSAQHVTRFFGLTLSVLWHPPWTDEES